MTSTPTRPVDNVVITTKGLQDRNIHILDGTTEENKGKLILTKLKVLSHVELKLGNLTKTWNQNLCRWKWTF